MILFWIQVGSLFNMIHFKVIQSTSTWLVTPLHEKSQARQVVQLLYRQLQWVSIYVVKVKKEKKVTFISYSDFIF